MATYVAPDRSFSLYYPDGWTVTQSQERLSIVKNPHDPMSTRISIMPFQSGEQYSTSGQIINILTSQRQVKNPTFNIGSTQQLSLQPDVTAVTYSYDENNVTIVGLGIAISHGHKGYWAEIYGRQNGFTGYDPPQVLTYVLKSLNKGTTPNKPQMTQAPQQDPAESQQQGQLRPEEYHQPMNDARVGAPDVFTTMPLW